MDDTEDSYVSFRSDEEENSPLELTRNRDHITIHMDKQGAPLFQVHLPKVTLSQEIRELENTVILSRIQ